MSLTGAVILQVIPDLSAGGAERTTVEITAALTAAGATALVASRGGRLAQELERAGGELIRMRRADSKNPLTLAANAGLLSEIIARRGVNLIHARSRGPGWSSLWAARRRRIPFVTTYHGVYNAGNPLKRYYNSVMARGDVVVANSEFTANHVRAEHPFAADRVVTIPRGVDIAAFTPEAVTADRKEVVAKAWGVDPGAASIILLPGRITGWKGHREAIAAAGLLAGRIAGPWRMVFAGDAQGRNDYVRELLRLAAATGLGDRLSIVGHCSDMPAAFALSELVIAPSREPEAFGRVAAEAGAMGLPVIGSDMGGQRDIIVPGVTGQLISPGSAQGLADAIAAILGAPAENRRKMGEAAMARVREKFTTAALQQATLAVYDRLIGQQR